MILQVGEQRARTILSEETHYTWIYERVLEDTEAIGEILKRHGLVIQPEE